MSPEEATQLGKLLGQAIAYSALFSSLLIAIALLVRRFGGPSPILSIERISLGLLALAGFGIGLVFFSMMFAV